VCVEWQQLPTQRKEEEENGGGEKGRRRQKVVRNSAGFLKNKKPKEKCFENVFLVEIPEQNRELFFRLSIPNR
jgi:hypothetical protein